MQVELDAFPLLAVGCGSAYRRSSLVAVTSTTRSKPPAERARGGDVQLMAAGETYRARVEALPK